MTPPCDLVKKVNDYILEYETAKKMYKNSIYYVDPQTVGCTKIDFRLGFQNSSMDRLSQKYDIIYGLTPMKTKALHYTEPTVVGNFFKGSYETTLIIIFSKETNTAFHLFGLNKHISDMELFVLQDRCPCLICSAPWYSIDQFCCPCCVGCLKAADVDECNNDTERYNHFIRKARKNMMTQQKQ